MYLHIIIMLALDITYLIYGVDYTAAGDGYQLPSLFIVPKDVF